MTDLHSTPDGVTETERLTERIRGCANFCDLRLSAGEAGELHRLLVSLRTERDAAIDREEATAAKLTSAGEAFREAAALRSQVGELERDNALRATDQRNLAARAEDAEARVVELETELGDTPSPEAFDYLTDLRRRHVAQIHALESKVAVLRARVEALREGLRETDLVARIGITWMPKWVQTAKLEQLDAVASRVLEADAAPTSDPEGAA